MPGFDRPRVHVDFNDMDPAGHFFVLPEDVEDGALALSTDVMLVDEEGNRALGHVAQLLDRGRAIIAMTAGSWHSGAVLPPVGEARSVQDLMGPLLDASLRCMRSVADLYKLSVVPSSVVTATAAPPSGRPEPRGAVPSTL